MAAEQTDHDFNELPQKAAARGFLPILWQRKALVLLGLVLGLGGGFLFYLQREPVYEARSLVLVNKKHSPPIWKKEGGNTQVYFEDYMASHVIVLKSPLIVSLGYSGCSGQRRHTEEVNAIGRISFNR